MRHLTPVERSLLGLLAMLFLATEIAGLTLPAQSFSFIAPRIATQSTVGALDDLGPGLKVSVARVASARALQRLLNNSGFDIAAIRRGQAEMPSLFLATLPEDLGDVPSIHERKNLFVGIVLPLILHHNAVVLERRARLRRLAGYPIGALARAEQQWLLRLARLYRVVQPESLIPDITKAAREELSRRVDTIPISLALAQAAAESGWGTSRFARRGNALFGQWTWNQGAGLIPNARDEGRAHAVRAFSQLASSVRAYAHNLNVSHHYRDFRFARALLRRAGPPDGTWGHILVGHLEKYSEEGVEYIDKIRSIIRVNAFGDFDTARIIDSARASPETSPGS
jgi:Bax protein